MVVYRRLNGQTARGDYASNVRTYGEAPGRPQGVDPARGYAAGEELARHEPNEPYREDIRALIREFGAVVDSLQNLAGRNPGYRRSV